MKSQAPRPLRRRSKRAWQTFEDFVTRVLARYYADYDVRLVPTAYVHDGGRDAEVTYIFAASKKSQSDLGIPFTIWVEVKSRGTRNVDLQDIGKNLVLALNAGVAKIIVVTDREFSSGLGQHIEEFCRRSRVSCSLINGAKLVALARDVGIVEKPPLLSRGIPGVRARGRRPKKPLLLIDLALTRNPALLEPRPQFAPIQCDPGAVLFITADILLENGTAAIDADLQIVPRVPDAGAVHHYGARSIAPLDPDERRRDTYVLFAGRSASALAADFDIRVPGCRVRTRVRAAGAYEPHISILADWVPPSKDKQLDQIDQSLRRWQENGRLVAHLLVASAGAGKSHAITKLRRTWISAGAIEITFNGESDRSDAELMERAFLQLFPLPPHLLLEDQAESINDWLVRSGLAPAAAERLAKAVCLERRFKAADFDSDTLGQVLASLLRSASASGPVVVLFEDMHKAHASALTLFEKTRLHLAQSGDARVCLIATTRHHPATDPTSADEWFSGYTTLINSEGFSITELKSLTSTEAVDLIIRTIPSLEAVYARAIVKQVGRTPFGIREAMNFLAGEGIMVRDSAADEWRIPNPELLYRAVRLNDLVAATSRRIDTLLRRCPALREVLQAGACIGSRFPLNVCLRAAGIADTAKIRVDIAEFTRLEVIRPTDDDSRDYVYDHDLVRVAVLEAMATSEQTSIAGRVLDNWTDLTDDYRAGLLAFQARRASECVDRLRQYASASRERSHHVEAVRALRLAIYCIDPDDAPRYASTGEEDFLIAFDEAVQAAGSVRVPGLTEEQRHLRVLEMLRTMITSLIAVGNSGSGLVNNAVVEGELLSAQYGDATTVAEFEAFAGRAAFGRGDFAHSIERHTRADALYAANAGADPALRVDNLVRLAIAMRQNGERDRSLEVLARADALRAPDDFDSEMKILANTGAVYFYSDHRKLREHWSRAVEAANRSGKPDRIAHALIDLAQVDLFDEDYGAARERLDAAVRLAERYALAGSRLRILLNGGCIDMLTGSLEVARRKLLEAEALAISMGALRRLWRVRANLGTVYHLLDRRVASLNADESAVGGALQLIEYYRDSRGRIRFYSREALPFANLALRAAHSERHATFLKTLDPSLRTVADRLAGFASSGELARMPSRLGAHCKWISDNYWFIVTE